MTTLALAASTVPYMVEWFALAVAIMSLGATAALSYKSLQLSRLVHRIGGPEVTVTCRWHRTKREGSMALAEAEIQVTNSGRLQVQVKEVSLIQLNLFGLEDTNFQVVATRRPESDVLPPQHTESWWVEWPADYHPGASHFDVKASVLLGNGETKFGEVQNRATELFFESPPLDRPSKSS